MWSLQQYLLSCQQARRARAFRAFLFYAEFFKSQNYYFFPPAILFIPVYSFLPPSAKSANLPELQDCVLGREAIAGVSLFAFYSYSIR
jgi:hypothetical protein